MGLDMWLYKVKHGEDIRAMCADESQSEQVKEVGYWRKFNALHSFLGRNTNCKFIPVSEKTIDTILDKLNRIMKLAKPFYHEEAEDWDQWRIPCEVQEEIAEILPTCSGLCFGDTDIGDWYMNHVENSIPIFKQAKKDINNGYDIYYYSWW